MQKQITPELLEDAQSCLPAQSFPTKYYTTFEVCTHALDNGTLAGLEMGNIIDCLPSKLEDIESDGKYVLILKDRTFISRWSRTEAGFISKPLNPIYSPQEVSLSDIVECFSVCYVTRQVNKRRLMTGTKEKIKKNTRKAQMNDANILSNATSRTVFQQ